MIFERHQLLSYFLLLLSFSLAFGWESIDTCQMSFLEPMEGYKWLVYLYKNDFSTDKSDLYTRLMNLRQGYGTSKLISLLTDVTNLDFDISAEDDQTVQTGTLFGQSITTTNFSMMATTYFEAGTDGDYTFEVEATDGVQFVITTDMSPYCCGNMNDANFDDILAAGVREIWSIPSDPTPRDNIITVSMREGVRYEMAIIYMNLSGDAKLKFTVTTPDGETITDFSNFAGYIAAIDCDNVHTTTRDYSGWTLDSTSTYSSTVVTIDMTTTTTLETIYYVVTPTAASSSIVESSTSEIPLTSDVSSEVPVTSDVSSEVPVTSDVSSEVPVTSDVSSDAPLTSDVSSEVPVTSDVSSETLSDTILTSAAISSYPSVDTSSTFEVESSATLSNEETITDTYSTVITESSTIVVESSTITAEPSTVITVSSSFLPSWFSSIVSLPSSIPATESDTAASTDLEGHSTSSNIDQETQSIVTTNPTAIESTPGNDLETTTTPVGNGDKTTTATVISTTTATVCSTCAGEVNGQGNGQDPEDGQLNDAATDATNGAVNTVTNGAVTQATNGVVNTATNEAVIQATNDAANTEANGAATRVNNGAANAATNNGNFANGAATTNAQANDSQATANQANTIAQGAGTVNTDTTSPTQVSSNAPTTTLQGTTPTLYSPEDTNAADQTRTNILMLLFAISIFM